MGSASMRRPPTSTASVRDRQAQLALVDDVVVMRVRPQHVARLDSPPLGGRRAAASRRRRSRRRRPRRPPRRRRDRRSRASLGACSVRRAQRYATRTPETRRNLTMGLLSRAGEIIRAKFSSLLNRAENPQETLDYSYERQLESLQNVKRGVADVVTAKKRLELQTAAAGAERRQARHAGPPGTRRRPGGSRPRGARAQVRDPAAATGSRHAGEAARRTSKRSSSRTRSSSRRASSSSARRRK